MGVNSYRCERIPWISLLLLLLLVEVLTATAAAADSELYWKCSGEQTTYTNRDCMRDKYDTSGCYYLDITRQFKSCKSICDRVVAESIDEERCEAHCSVYLRKNCHLENPTTPLKAVTAQPQRQHTTTNSFSRSQPTIAASSKPIEELTTESPESWLTQHVVITIMAAATGILLISILSWVLYLKSGKKKKLNSRKQPWLTTLSIQPVEEEMMVEITEYVTVMPSDTIDYQKEELHNNAAKEIINKD